MHDRLGESLMARTPVMYDLWPLYVQATCNLNAANEQFDIYDSAHSWPSPAPLTPAAASRRSRRPVCVECLKSDAQQCRLRKNLRTMGQPLKMSYANRTLGQRSNGPDGPGDEADRHFLQPETKQNSKNMNKRTHTAIDAFCGAGGLSLGLKNAGFDVIAAFDNDGPSVATYKENFGDYVFAANAESLTGQELRVLSNLRGHDLDLFAGGPPCQGFSKQKRGAHLGDPRNKLVLDFLRLVQELMPRVFLLENVPMVAQVRGKHLLDEFHGLERYDLVGHFYVAADYGVAQNRERFILVGTRDDVEGGFHVPPPSDNAVTVRDAIGDLPEPPDNYSSHPEYANHQAARVTQPNIERFSHVPEGGGWQDIPYELRLPCHQRADTRKGGWPDVYGRLRWDSQCPTITGGFDSFTRGRYGHPESDRPLTPREAARIQGFPDDHVFLGTRHDVRHQIGNAVPPPLAHAVGSAIDDALRGRTNKATQPAELHLFSNAQYRRQIVAQQ